MEDTDTSYRPPPTPPPTPTPQMPPPQNRAAIVPPIQPQQEQDISVPLPSKRNVKVAIIGFCLIILLAGVFYFGSYYTCKGSGELEGLKCKNVEVIGACEIEGKLYIQPEEAFTIITPRQDTNVTV